MKNIERKSRRELEIARELERLLNAMPFEFVLDLQAKLLALQESPFEQDLAIEREQILGEQDQRRLDIVVPLAPLAKVENNKGLVYRELIFELKLYQENFSQVAGYAEKRTDALVVSVYQTLDPQSSNKPNNVVQFTWTDLFWGLFPLLDLNAQRRVIGGGAPAILPGTLKFDYRKALGSVADRYLEDFLLDIKPLAKTNFHRVMVVTGETASKTADDGIYFCPARWDQDFDFLCVVHQKQLKFVGKVDKRAYPVQYEENTVCNVTEFEDDIQERLGESPFTTHVSQYTHGEDGAVTWLTGLSDVDVKRFPSVGSRFSGRGAVTQSHRYFDSPEAFTELFSSTSS